MDLQKPDRRILAVWRLRLTLGALLPSFFTAYFHPLRAHWLWWAFTGAWFAAFLYFYISYYPIKYRKLSYTMNSRCLVIHCGVVYTRVKAIPFTAIQYVSILSEPVGRLFGLRALAVYMAGGSAYIPGLRLEEALRLQKLLTPAEGEDA